MLVQSEASENECSPSRSAYLNVGDPVVRAIEHILFRGRKNTNAFLRVVGKRAVEPVMAIRSKVGIPEWARIPATADGL